MVIAVRLRVRGLVHGVFFRASLSQLADAEGVAGWVRNLSDGSVEAQLEGSEDSVDRLVEWSRHGPPSARVSSVEVTNMRVGNLKGFRIAG